MNKRDKIYIYIAIALVLLLFLKSFVLDNYKAQNDSEAAFMASVDSIVAEKYDGFIYDNLVVVKIVKVTEMSEREKKYKDMEGNMQTTSGTYKAKVRKYILGVLPYSEESILEGVSK